jgi:hypothetical protein
MQPSRSPAPITGATRMTLANVSMGKQDKPLRVCIYGVPGVGKSSFGAAAPKPIFLASEDGTGHLDVHRFPTPQSWLDVMEAMRVLTHEEHSYKTLVVDSLDWLEPLAWKHVAFLARVDSIDSIPFGKGFNAAQDLWRDLLTRFDLLTRNRRMNIVLVAHAVIKKVDDPQVGAFDRYRIPLHEKSADLVREWVDALVFARHDLKVVERNGKSRGMSSGNRLLHTTWTAAYDAKNRFDLPETLPLDWEEFERMCKAHAPADPARLLAEIEELLPQLRDEETRAKAAAYAQEKAGNPAALAQALDKLRSRVALQGDEGGAS